jgi:hypothetical protein
MGSGNKKKAHSGWRIDGSEDEIDKSLAKKQFHRLT